MGFSKRHVLHRSRWVIGLIAAQYVSISHLYAQSNQSRSEVKEAVLQSPDEAFLFFPTKFPNGDWQPAGLSFQDVFFTA